MNMPKCLKLYSLRNLMQYLPRQHYSIYKRLHKIYLPTVSSSISYKRSEVYFSILSSPQDTSKSVVAQLSSEFPEPKKIISQLLNEAYLLNQQFDIKPSVTYEQYLFGDDQQFLWKATLHMKWPEDFDVEGIAVKKADAENIAFLFACQKVKKFGVLDQSNKPLLAKDKFNISNHSVKIAKNDLLNIFQRIWTRHGKKEYIPKFNTVPLEAIYGGSKYWKSELHLSYPEIKVFDATATRLRDAENIASAKALVWLTAQGIISKNRRLILYSKDDEMTLRKLHQAPYSILIPPSLQSKMEAILTDLEKQKLLLSRNNISKTEENIEDIIDIITDKINYKLDEQELHQRSLKLYEKNRDLENIQNTEFLEIKKFKSSLPIYQKKENILKLLDENQVVVLSGETGCGKSTQVSQFILDHYIDQMKGAKCNIVVTQPRRISAVTIADRIAAERNENVGETVGYHIRLQKFLPSDPGAILYCTTGMLLRKLCSNPNLDGVSHVIVDEVHERNIHIDFLLILLKKILENNKSIKLLLMSATFNTNIFSQYFNYCPVINIPGKIFPVKEYFLEDLVKFIPDFKFVQNESATLDADLIVDVIKHINTTHPPGAILCFLSGWNDIKIVHSKLLEDKENASKFYICPIHSRLSHEEQKNIFNTPPDGYQKVILATNIAETSITVNDVVYVVNSGLHKGTILDVEAGIACLSLQWITKASVRQRRGRAGRVRPGVCFHLFSRKTLMDMKEYPDAEILRIPLEKIILDCKRYCPHEKAEDFLSKALQPPLPSSIQNGVNELQIMGVLDENEGLTELGETVVQFGTHPRLSVAHIYAAFFGCLDPVLTISAILTMEKEPFLNTLDDKIKIKGFKQIYDNGLCSDHIALYKMYKTWESISEETDVKDFLQKYLLDEMSLHYIKKLKSLFAEDLYNVGIINDFESYSDKSNNCNIYMSNIPNILATLTAAFFPNIIRIIQGEISHGKLNKDSLIYSLVKGQKAYIQKESVVSDIGELPSPWLTYFSAMKSEARRLAMVSSLSSVPGIALLLLTGRNVTLSTLEDNDKQETCVLQIDDYKKLNFSCSSKEARLLLDWRECMKDIFLLYILNLKKENTEEYEYMLFCKNKFMNVTKELLETPHIPFTKGQVYEFIDNNLIVKDL